MAKIYVSSPGTPNKLERQIWELYETSPRNTKSREMQLLLQGGIVLKNMGILDACIAQGLSEGVVPNSAGDPQAAMQAVIARIAEVGDTSRQAAPVSTAKATASTSENDASQELSESLLDYTADTNRPEASVVGNRPEAKNKREEVKVVDRQETPVEGQKINRKGGIGGMMTLGRTN